MKFEKCLLNCKVCSSATTCTTCGYPSNANTLYVDESQTPHKCIACNALNKYPSGTKCLNCGNFCVECEDASTCLTCASNNQNPRYALEGTTPVKCGDCSTAGTYVDNSVTPTPMSKNCPGHCSKCTSALVCTECSDPNKYLWTDKISCVGSCTGATVPKTGYPKVCLACPITCSVCSSDTVCTECITSSYFIQPSENECKADCPHGTYGDTNEKKCLGCSGDCDGCTSSTHCKACKNGKYLKLDKSCSENCDPGAYKSSSDPKVCIECPNQCLSCISENHCTECQQSGDYLQPDNLDCSTTCPPRYYKGEDLGIKMCLACPNGCLECSNANTCNQCEDSTHYLQQDHKTCKPTCDDGYFKSDTTPKKCAQCVTPCSTCTSATFCTGCVDSQHYLMPSTGTCSTECPSGYMKDPITKTCKEIPCPDQCHSCSQPNLCDLCKVDGLYLHPDQITCSPDCPKGTTKNSFTKKCDPIPCDNKCTSCSVPNECERCRDSNQYLRLDKTCSSSCASGSSKPNPSTMKCDPSACPPQCLTCNAENRCNVCKDKKLFLRPDLLSCSPTCPTGYVANSATMKCEVLECRHRENCK